MLGSEFDTTLEAARAGEAAAWEAIYRDLAPLVLGYLRSRRIPDADDLAGDVFVAVVKELRRFQGNERAFRTWVLTIAHHRMVDLIRQRARVLEQSTAEIGEHSVPTGDVEAEADARLGIERVRELISDLSPDQQDVLLLRILGDQKIEEVARIMGKTPGAVKQLQHRAVAALRRKLAGQGPYPSSSPERLQK